MPTLLLLRAGSTDLRADGGDESVAEAGYGPAAVDGRVHALYEHTTVGADGARWRR